jgi:phospholipid transport system transporter-binding protein
MRVEGGVARFEGDLVLDNATRLLAEGEAALDAGARAFDLSGVGNMDSSALSLILSLRRRGAPTSTGKAIEFRGVPESLVSLATLYGIADQI